MREALAMVTGRPHSAEPARPAGGASRDNRPSTARAEEGRHAPDLKETLGKIVASGAPKQAGLSEKDLRDMLAVEDVLDENA